LDKFIFCDMGFFASGMLLSSFAAPVDRIASLAFDRSKTAITAAPLLRPSKKTSTWPHAEAAIVSMKMQTVKVWHARVVARNELGPSMTKDRTPFRRAKAGHGLSDRGHSW
jgi:hypothetical protein